MKGGRRVQRGPHWDTAPKLEVEPTMQFEVAHLEKNSLTKSRIHEWDL